MACMLPGAQMTPKELACCRMMQHDCGHMQMPAGQDCCRTAPQVSNDNALASETSSPPPVAFFVCDAATRQISRLPILMASAVAHPGGSPPPESPPSTVSILRV